MTSYTSSIGGTSVLVGAPAVGGGPRPSVVATPTPAEPPRPTPDNPKAKKKGKRLHLFDGYEFWGEPIPVSFGKRRLPGTLIWSSKIRRIGNKRYVDFALALGYNLTPPANRLDLECNFIWADNKVIYARDWKVATTKPLISNPWCATAQAAPNVSVILYKGYNNQPTNGLVRRDKGTFAVGFPNMIYVIVRNMNLSVIGDISTVPRFEVLLAETFTGENILYRAPFIGATAPSTNSFAYDAGANRAVFLNSGSQSFNNFLRVFDMDTFEEVFQGNILPISYSSTDFTYNRGSIEIDRENSIMFASSSANNNKPCALINFSTGAKGATYYNGLPNQLGFGNNSFGSFDHGEFLHCGPGSVQGTYFVSACSSSNTIGLVSVDPVALTMAQVATIGNISGVHTIVASNEFRDSGTGCVYLVANNTVHRVLIGRGANAGNSASTVSLTQLADITPESYTYYGACVDETDGNLIVVAEDGSNDFVAKVDGTTWNGTGTPTYFWQTLYGGTSMERKHIKEANTRFGTLGIKRNGNNYSVFDLGTGTKIDTSSATNAYDAEDTLKTAVSLAPGDNQVWDSLHQGFVVARYNTSNSASTPALLVFGTDKNLNDDGVNIWEVLEWLAEAAGYTVSDIVTDIAVDTPNGEKCTGGIITERTNVWELIRELCHVYGIDVFESEGKIKFRRVSRSTTVAANATLTNADLLPLDSGDTVVQKLLRQRASDLPNKQELTYIDAGMLYQTNMVTSKRIDFPIRTTESRLADSVDIPIVLTTGRATQLVNRLLYYYWEGQRNVEFRVGRKYLKLEVGDIVQLNVDGADGLTTSLRARIREQFINEDFSITCHAVEMLFESSYDDQDDDAGLSLNEEELVGPNDSAPLIIDSPHPQFQSLDDWFVLGASYPLRNLATGWPGATTYRETSLGPLPLFANTVLSVPIIARLATVIPATTPWTSQSIDVDITIITGDNTSWPDGTPTTFLNGNNLCFVGSAESGWEILNYQDATILSATQVRLNKLGRGLRGTENQCLSDHGVGQYIVIYEATKLGQFDVPGPIGTIETFIAVAVGDDVEDSRTQSISFAGNSSKPYAPVNPFILSGSWGSDLTVKFWPRTRATYDLQDDESGFVGTDDDAYKVQILSGTGGSVLRTITGLISNQFTYTAAQQSTDFGSNPRSLYMRIYQVHPVHGDGFSVESRIYT